MEDKNKNQNTEKEEKLLQLIREIEFGEIHIFVADVSPPSGRNQKKRKILIEYRKYRLNNSRSYIHTR